MKVFRLSVLLAVVGLLGIVAVRAQTPIPFGPLDAVAFDYLDADLTAGQVASFEAQWDSGTWATLGIPASVILGNTIVGGKTYKVIPPFTSGTHTVAFRACNIAGCSSGSSPFAFAYLSSPAGVPSNVRKVLR